MAVRIPYKKVTDAQQAYTLVSESIGGELLEKYSIKAELTRDEANKRISAKGKGFELTVEFLPEACEIDLNLSFLLKGMKNKILKQVEGQFVEIL